MSPRGLPCAIERDLLPRIECNKSMLACYSFMQVSKMLALSCPWSTVSFKACTHRKTNFLLHEARNINMIHLEPSRDLAFHKCAHFVLSSLQMAA